jgi:hypothetical protein
MTDPQTIVEGLTAKEADLLHDLWGGFAVGDYFRPGEGQSATVFANLVKKDVFDSVRTELGTLYCLTRLGNTVRTHLEKESKK